MTPAADGALVAWTESAGIETRICLGSIDSSGEYRLIQRLDGASPTLASRGHEARMAFVDTHGLWVAKVSAEDIEAPIRVSSSPEASHPTLDAGPDGSWGVAWHGPVGEGILRWLNLARETEDGWNIQGPDLPEEEQRGEDQGWEVPALLIDSRGRAWLAGRSSGGFHVQCLTRAGWSPRLDLSRPGWSGRSLNCSLVEHQGEVLVIRGTTKGLCVSRLDLVGEAGVGGEAAGPPRSRGSTSPLAGPGRVPSPRSVPGSWSGPQILFGDIHQHSILSDGTGSAEEAYQRGRDHYGHDLMALTDHEKLGPRSMGPQTWRYLRQVADAYYDPGRFVTLPAYEFTGARLPGPGHKCVYFGQHSPDALPPKDSEALLALLREYDAIAVPHHVGWTGADLEHHDPALQPVWEICSVHGAYERAGPQIIPPRSDVVLNGQFIQDALDAGLVFGFVGGTDSHGLQWHHGMSRRKDPFRTGLAAVFADPTRQSVMAALRARRCYATSGARILLSVEVEGAPMGSEIRHQRPLFHVRVQGTAPVQRLSIILDGRVVKEESGGLALECSERLTLARSRSYAYARILQEDGEMAWSSPVWLVP